MRRAIIVLVVAAGCGFSGISTRDAPVDGLVHPTAEAPFDSGTDARVVVDGAAAAADAPVDSAQVVVCSGTTGGYCSSAGRCLTDCGGDTINCPGQDNSCSTCLGGARRQICASSCASSACACSTASNCPSGNELCAAGLCVACDAAFSGRPCNNGKNCIRCNGGGWRCASAPDKCGE